MAKGCVKVFQPRSGAGTQTITGITDRSGTNFVGKVFLFQSAYAVINTLTAGAIPTGGYSDFRGVDTGSVRSATTATDAYSPFNFKAADSGVSQGDHSLLDVWTDNFGQAQIERKAYISAVSSGSFELTYDTNGRTGDTVLCVVLGGDDLDIAFTNSINGTYTTPSKPQGLLALPVTAPAASGPTSWGTGGQNVAWGFATRDRAYGAANVYVVNQGDNFRVQRSDTWGTSVDGFGTLSAALPTVSAWGSTSFTIAGNTGGAVTSIRWRCAAMTFGALPAHSHSL